MRRRSLLGSVAALLALPGCQTGGSGDATATRPTRTASTTPTPSTTSPAGRVHRRVTVESVGQVPEGLPISLSASLTEPLVTDAHPARLELSLTNRETRRRIGVLSRAACGPFNRGRGASEDPPGLRLYDDRAAPSEDERDGDRWSYDATAEDPTPFPEIMVGCGAAVFRPGETKSWELAVWDDFVHEGYMLPGTYQFVHEDIPVYDVPETPTATPTHVPERDPDWVFDWTLTLCVESVE